MPQPDTALDLDQLLDAIEASISAAFPEILLVRAFHDDRRNLPVPACLIDLIDLEPTDNPGTGQFAAIVHIEASLIIGFREASAKRRVAKLAANVAHHAMGQRWGLPIAPAVITACAPSDFDPELDQYEVWAVEWQQEVHFGTSIWDNDGTQPGRVFIGLSPEIGPAHVEAYTEITGGSQ